MDRERLQWAYSQVREALLSERHVEGYWEGELSSSALATATAISALKIVGKPSYQPLIERGIRWLVEHQNPDGGWGDTVQSFSNISTTMLCRAAFSICDKTSEYVHVLNRCETWLTERYGSTPQEWAEAVRQRYGKDRTFAVPILTMCALAGLVSWNEVPRLPFELACLPQSWYRFAHLPVVSYALPALIAIGQTIQQHRPGWNPFTRSIRWLARNPSLNVLARIQPSSGGYLEATPLTSFVVMSLASMQKEHPAMQQVIDKGTEFLIQSIRADGSWAIDSNLSVWVTTLSINALATAQDLDSLDRKEELLAWLLQQQGLERHPYTGAEAGGWGWSHLPGSVPDCDDTPGMLIALRHLLEHLQIDPLPDFVFQTIGKITWREIESRGHFPYPSKIGHPGFHVLLGLQWLGRLQNRDGGWPTFCKGWGALPFDRSGTDLTAHALRAMQGWLKSVAMRVAGQVDEALNLRLRVGDLRIHFPSRFQLERQTNKAFRYLAKQQRADGSWLPLWFGNQHAPDDENPVYGTCKVLAAYRDLGQTEDEAARKGIAYLLAIQNSDGSWGSPNGKSSSVEETALAVEILWDLAPSARLAVERGVNWLLQQVEAGTFRQPSPIGFYFAKLWYYEKLYPLTFLLAALGRVRASFSPNSVSSAASQSLS